MLKTNELVAERHRAGVTQRMCANALGISLSSYREKENNRRSFDIDEVKQLCSFLCISDPERQAFIFLS